MVSKRIGVALVASVAMVGCFEGDLGNIVFDTNLVVDGQPWNPDAGVADGQIALFVPHEGTDGQELPTLETTVTGGLQALWQEGQTLAVTGAEARGRVVYDGEVRDHFRVRFSAPARAAWIVHPGLDPVEEVAVLAGAEATLAPALRDRRGRPLGYAPDALEGFAEGAASAWSDTDVGTVHVAGDQPGPVGLVVARSGEVLPLTDLVVVSRDEVVQTTLEEACVWGDAAEADCEEVRLGWTEDGVPVLGL